MSESEVASLKARAKETWSAGDYASIADRIADVGERVVDSTAIGDGDLVLDVACGAGNAAIPAARRGGRVTGLDLTPELLAAGREAAAAAGVEVEFVEGDAEELPFGDASFDVVVSTFGHMFAPRHDVTAAELARVLRPGGRLGLCCWTPEGHVGGFFRTIVQHVPPPPGAMPPPLWGTEDHARAMLEPHGVELRFERHTTDIGFGSADDLVAEFATKFGPVIKARETLESEGGWEALRDDLTNYFESVGEPREDGLSVHAEYLLVLGRRA